MGRMETNGASELSPGERLERSRRRRKLLIIGGVVAISFAAGFGVGFTEGDELFVSGDRWPPAVAATLAVLYLGLVFVVGLALRNDIDEVERLAKYKAAAAGLCAFVLVYPVWFLLWKGGFVAEPSHLALYVLVIVSALGASIYYRFR